MPELPEVEVTRRELQAPWEGQKIRRVWTAPNNYFFLTSPRTLRARLEGRRTLGLERPLLLLSFANPVDLARVLLLLHMDVAALMGATGAVFHKALGGPAGTVAALGGLVLWTLVPGLFALRAFRRRDF